MLPYFPPAVHLVVVDPGVGTGRDALVVRAGEHVLVGPDNGVLLPAARRLGEEVETFEIAYDQERGDPDAAPTEQSWPLQPSSSTFHGRDLFAPAAAHIHEAGRASFETDEGFTPASDVTDLVLPDPELEEDGALGEALAVDDFGNVITNIPGSVLTERFGDHVNVNGVWASARRAYDMVDTGHRVVTVGSHGNVELAVNQGRGDDIFGVHAGGRVRLSW